jgi:hypothetical protein
MIAEDDLRDCFAMFALLGLVQMNKEPYDDVAVAELSYRLADVMLEARKVKDEAGIAGIEKRKYTRKI